MEANNDGAERNASVYSRSGPWVDAAGQPLVRPAMDPAVDDLRDPGRRRLAVVCHASGDLAFRRCPAICGCGGRKPGERGRDRPVPVVEAGSQTEAPLPDRIALLGDSAAAGPVFVPV